MSRLFKVPRTVRFLAVMGVSLLLAACATGPDLDPTNGIYDPYETQNRKVHDLNRDLDRAIVRPAARAYGAVLPAEVEKIVRHFATNLEQPGVLVNSLLQGDLRGSGISLTRFVMNSTIGIGGLIDAATELGLPQHDTDFGETLYVWGSDEGPYVELPLLGPSTARDAAGRAVDFFTNPLGYALDAPEKYYGTIAGGASALGTRDRFASTIDGVLYESADSYAQSRLIYLQNRRFKLGQDTANTAADPYEDPYDDPYAD